MKILYFAWLRQKTGIDSEDVVVPEGVSDVAGLIEWLMERNEKVRGCLVGFRIHPRRGQSGIRRA